VSLDDKATVRAALARIRLLRALAVSSHVREALSLLAVLLPGLVCVGLFALLIKVGGLRHLGESPLVLSMILVVMFGAISMAVFGMPVAMIILLKAALTCVLLPYYAYVGVRAWRRRGVRREAEAMLDRDGTIPKAWAEGNTDRTVVLALLGKADRWLERRDGAIVARALGPRRDCASCGGESQPVGEGVWRCAHCGREAFTELPEATELATARARLLAVSEGMHMPQTRRALWRSFVAEHGKEYLKLRQRLKWVGGIYLGLAVIAELGHRTNIVVLMTLPLAGLCILVLAVLYFLSVVCGAWFKLRFSKFGPGVAGYDRALLGEIVACVALQGRMKRPTLAKRLSITVEHLDAVLARFDRLGGAPVLLDRTKDELISLCAAEIGDRACPACGGELAPARPGKVECKHCHVTLVLGAGHVAPHGLASR